MEKFILVITIFLVTISSMMSISWFLTNYKIVWVNQMHRFKQKNPHRNPNSMINFFMISIIKSILLEPEILSFLLHIVFGLGGILFNPYMQSFHLFMIINISHTIKYVIQAITTHYDQLVSTIMLVCIIIFSFSMLAGQFYFDLFDS